MAAVTYDGQSFSLDGRRAWIVGASIEYSRVPPEAWADRIAAARQAGFNLIATSCPWMVHEPRRGRYAFHGPTDVRHFVELCGQAGMWVMLRPGPFVGGGYDAGGLPSWLLENSGVALREASEAYLERVSLYFRKLLGELADLQVTHGGPILLLQSEHAWLCSNQKQAERYLREITRYLRENGITVPIVNANDLWQESAGTIDTWRGRDELLVHLRQLRVVQPKAPRVVSEFDPAGFEAWGDSQRDAASPERLMHWLAQVLAAGAQPVVWPFHGGTNFGFLGGRAAGRRDGFLTTSCAAAAPLGEAGRRGSRYNAIKRLATFANHFGHVFADLAPDYQPVALDLADPPQKPRAGGGAGARRVSVVHLRGAAGQVIFVFSDAPGQEATLLLEEGIRMPVALGDQAVGWFLVDVDLRGSGRLDYVNLCPWGLVDRSTLVLQGPAGAPAYLSIDGSPLEAAVPLGDRPLVLHHKRLSIVICNQQQIDETLHDDRRVIVGAGGLNADGSVIAGRRGTAWVIAGGKEEQVQAASTQRGSPTRRAAPLKLETWQAAPSDAYTAGSSPRFATLEGPGTLSACGAASGYGWYRIQLKTTSSRRGRWHLPFSADRLHLFLDGKRLRTIGVGRGADRQPFDQSMGSGQHSIVALVDNMGRFSEGNDLGERKGLFGHIYEVKRLSEAKPRKGTGAAVDPFSLRGYIAGRTFGQLSDTNQVIWSFTHTRKTPVLVEIDGAEASGTIVFNGKPIAYYAGTSGGCMLSLLLDPESKSFKRGKNELRFAPDPRQPGALQSVAAATDLYECLSAVSGGAAWAFAKWEPPPAAAYRPATRSGSAAWRGIPCWWRTSFEPRDSALPMWFETAGLSKGQVFVNGHNLGRYFTATAEGKPVGPQRRLYLPDSWLKPQEPNELLVFDEHGNAPHRTQIVFSEE